MSGEFQVPDSQQALLQELHGPCLQWAEDLAQRGGPLLSVNPEIPRLENDSVVHLLPHQMSPEKLSEYDVFFEPGAGVPELTHHLQESGILDAVKKNLAAGKKILVASNHSTHIDPALLGNAFCREIGPHKNAVMLNIAMDYVCFAGERIPEIIRKSSHVLKTAPDTHNGLKYLPENLRSKVIRQAGRATKDLSDRGLLLVLNPSGTIDKAESSNENRRKMHAVKDGTITLIRGFDFLLPVALEVTQPTGRFKVQFEFGQLEEIPRGKDHPKEETRKYVHKTMNKIAGWNTILTNGSPEVFYEELENKEELLGPIGNAAIQLTADRTGD